MLTCILRKVNSIYSNNCDCEWIRNNRTKDKSISSRFAQFCYDRLYIFIYLYRQEFSSKIIVLTCILREFIYSSNCIYEWIRIMKLSIVEDYRMSVIYSFI